MPHWDPAFIHWLQKPNPAEWLAGFGTPLAAGFGVAAFRQGVKDHRRRDEQDRIGQARKVWFEEGLRAYLWEDMEAQLLKPTLDLVVHNNSAEPVYDVVAYVPDTPTPRPPRVIGAAKAIGWKMLGPGDAKPVTLVTDEAQHAATLRPPLESWLWFPQVQFNDSAGIRWTRAGQYLIETVPEYVERLPAGSP